MALVTCGDASLHFLEGTPMSEVLETFGEKKALLVIVNGKLRELFTPVKEDCRIVPVGADSSDGELALKRTACMLLFKAAREVGKLSLILVDTLPEGLFFTPEEGEVDEETLLRMAERMRDLIARRLPVQKRNFHMDEAMEIFKAEGMEDRIRLFRYRRVSSINLYCIEGTYDYFYGFMIPHTGLVGEFSLKRYAGGILLTLPGLFSGEEQSGGGKLLNARLQEKEWEERLGLRTIADLNDRICEREVSPLILTCEAAFEARIAQVAEKIVEKGSVRFVMIAGPSSSGKTTFSHRLSIQLSAL
ncbi:MAG: nucleoside kinase, partial [Blautia sp.]|nr:nucleoside kinase [Blautia sp.]